MRPTILHCPFTFLKKSMCIMKYALIMIGLLTSVVAISSERQARREAEQQAVMQHIESQSYEIDVNQAQPMGWKSVNLTSSYSVRISGDSIYCHLPYYGRAYSIPYGGGEGLIFSSTMNGYSIANGKRGVRRITFDANSQDGNNKFSIEIWPTGQSSITVTPAGRQTISYSGRIKQK